MGSLSVLGLALPNAPHLSDSAHVVDTAHIGHDMVQEEIDALLHAAHGIASMPGIVFAGLAHSQLQMRDGIPPLRIMAVPGNLPGLPVEFELQDGTGVQCLINAGIEPPDPPQDSDYTLQKEGCFSSGPVGVIKKRLTVIRRVTAWSRHGEPVTFEDVDGLTAHAIQHENDHHAGQRPADDPWGGILTQVHREDLTSYRVLGPQNIQLWPRRFTAGIVRTMLHDPSYDFFPTTNLQEAFWAGREQQEQLMQAG